MKKRFLILFLLMVNFIYANPFSGRLGLVVIDPGHGGHDPGAIGYGINEKDITLKVALKLDEALKKEGIETILTRSDDVYFSLEQRVVIARSSEYKIGSYPVFISIHCNSSEVDTANGFEIFVKKKSSIPAFYHRDLTNSTLLTYSSYTKDQLNRYLNIKNKDLAEKIREEFKVQFHELRDRGIKETDYFVLVNNPMTSVLLELGFISNEAENKLLKDEGFQNSVVKVIVNALKKL